MLVPVLFGIGCAVCLWCAVYSRDVHARTIAGYLVTYWALANAAWQANMLLVLPVLDLWIGIVSVTIWWTTRARWVALVAHAAGIRLILHVLDGLTGHLFIEPYLHALNATFAWMLVVVASSGGNHVRNTLLRRLRGFRRAVSPAPARGLIHGRR